MQRRLTLRWEKSFKIFFFFFWWDNIRRVCLGEPIKSLPCRVDRCYNTKQSTGRLARAAAARLHIPSSFLALLFPRCAHFLAFV